MDQRRRVDHLDDGRQHRVRGPIAAAGLAGQEHQRRPQPLAAEVGAVVDQVLDEREPAAQLGREDPLGLGQLGGDRGVEAPPAAGGSSSGFSSDCEDIPASRSDPPTARRPRSLP